MGRPRLPAVGWGRRLERLLRAAGLLGDLEEAAGFLGVHAATLYQWRRGHQEPLPMARKGYEALLRERAEMLEATR